MLEPIGTWGGKNASKRATGISSKTACDTCVGAHNMLSTGGKKFFCFTCKTMETVTTVTGLEQFASRADYDCKMSCGCQRIVSVSVQRSEASLAALREQKLRSTKFRFEHSELIDEIPREILEIRDAMKDARLG
jgi:hypothetical protein